MKSVIKLNQFFSVSIQLLERAAAVIHHTQKTADYIGIQKGEMNADVFTLADVHINNTVKYNLE